jgi:phage portal protein BeeE
MNALELVASSIARPFAPRPRRDAGMSLDDVLQVWSAGQLGTLLQQTMRADEEQFESNFEGLVRGAFLRNSVVFACLALRARLFSEVRFAFQQLRNGRPGNLFGMQSLRILEHPEPGITTADMLKVQLLDADLAGDAFLADGPSTTLRRLRPDWTIIAYGSKRDLGTWDPDANVIGYGHRPGGLYSGEDLLTYGPNEVSHFVTNRDPLARNRGVSLLTAGIREIQGDTAATAHKLQFFRNGATVNMIVAFPPDMTKETADEWIELYEQGHRGVLNAYRTLYLGGGPTATPVGSTMEQMTFTELQGKAETRIAALTGMHPVIAALSEGLSGSSLNAGNFAQAARNVADTTLRPLWRDMAGSLEVLVPPPPGSRLWYDERDIAFLREDVKDKAEVISKEITAIGQAIKDGFEPQSAVDAVTSGDYSQLVHTGLVSVQLQPPGASLPSGQNQVVTQQASRPYLVSIRAPQPVRALADFWPLSGPFVEGVAAGDETTSDHPLARAYPSLFAPLAEQPSVVSGAVVRERRRALIAAGKPAGLDTLAAEFGVGRSTISRRLKE